jgi:hypothetical protein
MTLPSWVIPKSCTPTCSKYNLCNDNDSRAVMYESPFMRLPLLLSTLLFITACSHDGVDGNSASLAGKWKLTASAISIGGPATWQDADPNNPSYVEFTITGKMIFSNKSGDTRYDYIQTEEGKFTVTGNGVDVIYWYTIQGNVLTLNGGGCIEQCSSRYKRI